MAALNGMRALLALGGQRYVCMQSVWEKATVVVFLEKSSCQPT
jgi:hypothetical protein